MKTTWRRVDDDDDDETLLRHFLAEVEPIGYCVHHSGCHGELE